MENFSTLTIGQEENPLLAFEEIFTYADHPQMKELLWHWYKATATGSFNKSSVQERSEITVTFEFTLKLLDAAHRMHQKQRTG